jgi:threonine aldolase
MIEDWEICQLFRAERERLGEDAALQKVAQKYYDEFTKEKELFFVLGTESNWNNWLIISVFYPKRETV